MEGFILGGGASTRMGVDKARVAFPGRDPLAVEVGRVLRAGGCTRVALVRRGWSRGSWGELDLLYEEPHEGTHPLYGVAAALAAARGPHALVVSCDLPWLTAEAVATLIDAGPCVALGERMQPLVAVWPTAWATRLLERARAGGSVRGPASELTPVQLPPAVLQDLDDWRSIPHDWPVQTLLGRLPFLDEAARARVAAGEVGRLFERGAIDPAWSARIGDGGARTPTSG